MAERLRRRDPAPHPGLAGGADRGRRGALPAHRPRVRRQRRADRRALDDRDGRRHQPLVPLRPDLPGDALPGHLLRLPGGQRRRLGALRRPGEGAAADRLADGRLRPRLEPAGRASSRRRPSGTWPPTSGATRPSAPRSSPRRPAPAPSPARGTPPTATRRRPGWAGCPPRRASTATRSTSPTRPARRAASRPSTSSRSCAPGASASPARTPTTRPTSPASSPSGAPTCSAPPARATSTSCATSSASPTRPCARPSRRRSSARRRSAGTTQAPEGKLDLFTTIDFRMNGSAIYSDVVLPAATWYEKHDLSSTDLHPFVHPFNAAIPPPWEAKSDWDAFNRIADRFSELAAEHLGTRTDIVATPLLHDTPDELAQPGGRVRDWRAGECEPVPGRTMPKPDRGRARLRRGGREDDRARARWSRSWGPGRRASPGSRTAEVAELGKRNGVVDGGRRRAAGRRWRATSRSARRSWPSPARPTGASRWRASAPSSSAPAARSPTSRRSAPTSGSPSASLVAQPRKVIALGRVVGPGVPRAPLLALHRQRRALDPLADADRAPAALPRPRVDARPRRGPARLPPAGRRRAAARPRRRAGARGRAGGHRALPDPALEVVDPLRVPGQPARC